MKEDLQKKLSEIIKTIEKAKEYLEHDEWEHASGHLEIARRSIAVKIFQIDVIAEQRRKNPQ